MSTPRQLPMTFEPRTALAKGDFVVSDTNRAAFDAVCDPALGTGRLMLSGAEGSGKTHLAAVWAELAGARIGSAEDLDEAAVQSLATGAPMVIEDADRVAGRRPSEHLLFHALNLSASHGARLLVTGRRPPARWGIVTPDLASRLTALPHVAIGAPDDILLSSILDKLLSDRQTSASTDAVRFLVPRMERSFAAAVRIVAELDRRALAEMRPISRSLVRDLYASHPDLITGTGEP